MIRSSVFLIGELLAAGSLFATVRIERTIADAVAEIDVRQTAFTNRCSLVEYSADIVRVGGTNVWTRALQRTLNEHAVVTIPPSPTTPYWIDSTVIVPSGRRIEARGATVALLPGVRVLMLRNEHTPDGTLRPIGPDVKRDHDIAIVGGRWEDWARDFVGTSQGSIKTGVSGWRLVVG